MNSPKKSSNEDLFCDFAVGTYTFAAVAVVVGKNSTPVFTEEYNSETCSTSFGSMSSSTGTYSGTTWQSSSKKCCSSSSESSFFFVLFLFSLFCAAVVFFRCVVCKSEKKRKKERKKERSILSVFVSLFFF